MRVLDLGCGGGAVTLKIAALVGAEGEVVGIDLDSSILRLAQQEADGSKLPMTFHHLDAEELDEVAVYDFVYSRYLLSHLRKPERALEAMVRALRPEAYLLSRTSSSPGMSVIHSTPPSTGIWSSTRRWCEPKAQTRRSVRA